MSKSEVKCRLDLNPTVRFHQILLEHFHADPNQLRRINDCIRRGAADRAIRFERDRALPLAVSAVILNESDVGYLADLTERLHAIVEHAINWTLADPDRLVQHFPDHVRMAGNLARTRGLESWQGYCRYDAVVTAGGSVKFIELNTCCPAGFLHAPDSAEIVLDAIQSLNGALSLDGLTIGTLERGVLVDEMLAIERAAGQEEELIALLNDENQLSNELEMMATAFQKRGREVTMASAADLTYDGTTVRAAGRPVSLTWNKIRVSTADSPNHCWKSGFEHRYAPFLHALRDGAMVSVNNLVAATVAEDKNMLGLLYNPDYRAVLCDSDQQFIDGHVLWTARLTPCRTVYRGRDIDLMPYVLNHPEQFIIKPANEGRGFRVTVGRYASTDQWQTACTPDPACPCVVQEYAEPAALPILSSRSAESPDVVLRNMCLTIAMGVVRGKYHGLFSRVAAGPVTNVGQAGMIQAVFVQRQ